MSPTPSARPSAGLFADPRPIETLGDLLANVWQLGYVAHDVDRARVALAEQLGIDHALEIPTEGATVVDASGREVDWATRVLFAAKGGMIVEVIQPTGGEVDFYRRFLPAGGADGLRLQHLATFIPGGDEAWEDVRRLLAASGLRIDWTITLEGHVRAGYVDTTERLGHWLEICQLEPADVAFFEGLARDSA